MSRQVVIFARAPQRGQVKRRLARDVGPAAALAFHRRTLEALIRRLERDGRWQVWLCATPERSLGHPAFRGVAPARRRPQGQGDLGRRMLRPFRDLPPGPLVLVGSDIPALAPRHIARAFHLLGRHDLVFGPAADGGFWLVGARRSRPLPARLFAGVRWSTDRALADTLATIPAHWSAALADTLDDVDDGAGLRRALSP